MHILHVFCIGHVLDMLISLCYCVLWVACSDDHLLCYMIIVVISIWLFWCMIKFLTCFTSCLLDRNLLVILYLSFLSLNLPWKSNVFCANVSGYRYICSKFIITPKIHDRGRKTERALCYINYVCFVHSLWLCLAI